MTIIKNIYFRHQTPYSLKTLAGIIDTTYAAEATVDEPKQKLTFSPSKLVYGSGTCPRYWYGAFKGTDFYEEYDAQSIDNMEAGRDGHERIQRNVAAATAALGSEIEVDIIAEDPPIKGFCDIVLKFEGWTIPVEIKTTRTEVFAWRRAKNRPADYHVVQLLLYLHVLDLQYGLLMYEDKNDHSKLLMPVEMNAKNRIFTDYVLDWMRTVYKAYEEDTLPKKQVRSNAKICKSCPVSKWCDGESKEGVDIPLLKIDAEKFDI